MCVTVFLLRKCFTLINNFELLFQVFADIDKEKLKSDAEFWALMFLALGIADGVSLLTSVNIHRCIYLVLTIFKGFIYNPGQK